MIALRDIERVVFHEVNDTDGTVNGRLFLIKIMGLLIAMESR
jgi:hypothetical protein